MSLQRSTATESFGLPVPAIERVLGYRPEELLGTSGFALIYPEDVPKTRETFAIILQNTDVSGPQFALRGRHKDGSWRYLEALGKNVTRESTQSGIVLCLRDVTAHRQAEATLADRTRQLEAIRAITTEIICELDLPGVLNLIARHAVALVGATSGGIRLWNPEPSCSSRRPRPAASGMRPGFLWGWGKASSGRRRPSGGG